MDEDATEADTELAAEVVAAADEELAEVVATAAEDDDAELEAGVELDVTDEGDKVAGADEVDEEAVPITAVVTVMPLVLLY